MVGIAEIRDPTAVACQLDGLRLALLDDPYFALAPSLDPERRKTALAFHAKDDLPEVRWRVYELLRKLDVRVTVAVRHKDQLEIEARRKFQKHGIKLCPDEVYDALVTRLFTGRLVPSDKHHVVFALRKKSFRIAELNKAVNRVWTSEPDMKDSALAPKISITSCKPCQSGGLQVVDYFLWAVQRLFERLEDRFFAGMERHYDVIIDIDGAEKTLQADDIDVALRLRAS